jgi:hypothetical protein
MHTAPVSHATNTKLSFSFWLRNLNMPRRIPRSPVSPATRK